MSSTANRGEKNWNVKEIASGAVVSTYDSEKKAKGTCARRNKLYGREAFAVECEG